MTNLTVEKLQHPLASIWSRRHHGGLGSKEASLRKVSLTLWAAKDLNVREGSDWFSMIHKICILAFLYYLSNKRTLEKIFFLLGPMKRTLGLFFTFLSTVLHRLLWTTHNKCLSSNPGKARGCSKNTVDIKLGWYSSAMLTTPCQFIEHLKCYHFCKRLKLVH